LAEGWLLNLAFFLDQGYPPTFKKMSIDCCTAQPEVQSANVAKIIKQVEFYFSDANLPRDRFLQEELKKNEEGWIALSTIASFTRMKALASSVEEIAAALRGASETSNVEVSEDGVTVRRKTALPETVDNIRTSVFVRGFPVEEGTTLEALESFFEGVCTEGTVAAIRMRRNPQTKSFKGSVFLQLKSEEEVARLVELKSFAFNESVNLEILSMTAFMEEQNAKAMARSKKSDSEAAVEAEPLTAEGVKAMILTITGCPTDLDHRLLRTALLSKGPVAFVENVTAEGCSVVRFKEPMAAELIEKINSEGGITMPNIEAPLQAREATVEEIEAFVVKMKEFKAKSNNAPKQNRFKRFKRS
jgi:lupus La protein